VPAFHHAFLTAAGIIVAAGLAALAIRDSDAAASMRQRARGPAVPVAASSAAAEAGAAEEAAEDGP
jgi:hypothetical protein